ncbi:MAG: CHASE3 domain-containing protein [bacterium]
MVAAFVAVVIALGLMASVAWYANTKLVAAKDLVAHTNEVLTTLEKITSEMAKAEAAQRGYFLLHTPRFLEEREQALGAVRACIRSIEQLTADNVVQRRRIDLLKDVLRQRIVAAAATQERQDVFSEVDMASYFAKGAFLAAQSQDLTEKIKTEEKLLLAVRNTEEVLRVRFAQGSFILLMGSLLIVLLFLARRIHHDIGLQEQADNALRIAHDELEARVQQRTAELETVNLCLKVEIADHKEAQKALRGLQYSLNQLATHQTSIREDERKRIARDIHDELGQSLLVLRIDLTLLQTRALTPHENFHEKIGIILESIGTIMRSVRLIINDLRPAVLDLGLYAAIEWQLQQFQLRTGIVCVLMPGSHEIDLTEGTVTSLFRVLQESLTNVGRHSQATRVVVALHADANIVRMTVSDNGVGIAHGNEEKKDSYGLMGMQERISSLGGHVEIITAQGSGVKVAVSIPKQLGDIPQQV